MDKSQDWLKWAGIPSHSEELALFANTPYVQRAELAKWITGGVRKYGPEAMIIDHIDHMDHGDGQNIEAVALKKTVTCCSGPREGNSYGHLGGEPY